MVTARKLDSGQVQVDAKCTDVPGGCKEFPFGFLLSPEDALILARNLRDAADPWSVDACIEWMSSHWNITVYWKNGVVNYVAAGGRFFHSHQWPDILTGLRECVHVVAERRGIQCPLGDMCAFCHPPALPVPTDEELARMGTEWLIRWIEGTGHKVLYSTTDDPGSCPWSACRYQPHSHLKADTLLGLAKAVAAQLREANEDA